MPLAMTVKQYLANRGVEYEVLTHRPTLSSLQTAEATHVPGDRLAKAIVLKDEGGYLMAVLPASHHIRFRELQTQLNRRVGLATEQEVEALFKDCDRGAVPPIGEAYGLDVIIDDSLAAQPDVYFEGGDHASLLHVTGEQFGRLMADARHGRFSDRQ
ncbi:MAG: aminoacyl-tRNA deacylase [Pseudomonadota bacterium]